MCYLRTVRKQKGLTQEELAGLIGLRQSTLAEIETGKRTPQKQTMQKIESILGKQVDWRLTLSGEDHSHIMYKMVELINEEAGNAQERLAYVRQCLQVIENTLNR